MGGGGFFLFKTVSVCLFGGNVMYKVLRRSSVFVLKLVFLRQLEKIVALSRFLVIFSLLGGDLNGLLKVGLDVVNVLQTNRDSVLC